MRKEISSIFKFETKKTRKGFLITLFLITLFIVVNGLIVYLLNPSNYYFFVVKKVVPYPAFVVGNKVVTFSHYDDKLSESKKIYEVAYRINFDSGSEGKKNLDILRENVEKEIIDSVILEGLLKSNKMAVTNIDIKNEYDNMLRDIGSDKEILNLLKYSSGIKDGDIKDRIYQNILKERVKNNFVYNLKMKVIVIKPENTNNEEDWNKASQQAQSIYNDVVSSNSNFDKYAALYGDKNDSVVQNFGREYYFSEDLPKTLVDGFYGFGVDRINGPIKGDNGYYLFNVYEKRGYYKGSYEDFMKEQRNKVKILSFLH